MADAEEKTITIVYDRIEDCPDLPVGGAYGGVSPDVTTVVAHLFTEFGTVPAAVTHPRTKDGAIDLQKGDYLRTGDITRRLVATLHMSPDVARRVGEFLIEKANFAENNAGGARALSRKKSDRKAKAKKGKKRG